MNKELAEYILLEKGYNYALYDVEEACKFLDHPELKPDDITNFHKWAEPYERRCYCSAIGYTNKGRFYAVKTDDLTLKMLHTCFPGKEFKNKQGEPYGR